MNSVIHPSLWPTSTDVLLASIFNSDTRYWRSWSTSLHVRVCPMTLLAGFTVPTLSALQAELQATATADIANGRYPFSSYGRRITPPLPSAYALSFGGSVEGSSPPIVIGIPDGSATPVLLPSLVLYKGAQIDVVPPLLAALRATSQDFAWLAIKWNSPDLSRYPELAARVPPGSTYP
jgi:hypothetical protein